MQAQGIEWGEDYRRAAGAALKEVLGGRMILACFVLGPSTPSDGGAPHPRHSTI